MAHASRVTSLEQYNLGSIVKLFRIQNCEQPILSLYYSIHIFARLPLSYIPLSTARHAGRILQIAHKSAPNSEPLALGNISPPALRNFGAFYHT